jgi:hypothetical protein
MSGDKYAKAKQRLIEVCDRYAAHNKLQLNGLIPDCNYAKPLEFFKAALNKDGPSPGFKDWVRCVYYEIKTSILRLAAEDELEQLRHKLDDTNPNLENQDDPEEVLKKLRLFMRVLISVTARLRGIPSPKDEGPYSVTLATNYNDDDPLSFKIYITLIQLKMFVFHVYNLERSTREKYSIAPDFKTEIEIESSKLFNKVFTTSSTFEKYLKGIAVAELSSSLKNSSLTDKELIFSFPNQLMLARQFVLTKNNQSKMEYNLKLLSVIGILFGVGIFTTLGLVIKRLYDTGGTSINFFKPLSTNLYEDVEAISVNCLNLPIPSLQ